MPYPNKQFTLTSSFKSVKDEEDGSITIRGMASTSEIDRGGDIVAAEAWTKGGLSNFLKNPIILFNHNYNSPCGRAIEVNPTSKGLELVVKISKSAPNGVWGLIKDGILGAFSVGFLIKDADYIEETGGLRILDAELLETSVVSIPMNQSALFSVAKSFDSAKEFEEFKNTFNKSVALAGQSLAKQEVNTSNSARNAPDGLQFSNQKEIDMTKEELEALATSIAQKTAEETSAKIAMKQAEKAAADKLATEKAAAEKAAAEKAAAEKAAADKVEIERLVSLGVSTGAEALVKDFQAQLDKKDADIADVVAKFKKDLEEKSDEIAKMRESKKFFGDRAGSGDVLNTIKTFGNDFLTAHMLGIMTNKGLPNTKFGAALLEKAGIDYVSNAPDIDQEVSRLIEKEIMRDLKVARLFREIQVNGAATVLPIQMDTGLADWAINATSGNLENRGASDNSYKPKQVILNAYRLVSSTFMDNDVDEQVLVNLMPMLVESVARAHARTVERTILNGDGASSPNIGGLTSYAATATPKIDLNATSIATGNSALLTADILLAARQGMGKYGINPSDLAYIVSQNSYYDLLSDSKFQTLDEVGNDLAVRVNGSLGAVYGTPVVVSDEFPAETAGAAAAYVVNTRNYVIPRLRGVKVETDYEVMNQRRVIVASQALGFEEILPGDGSGTEPAVKVVFIA